MPSPLLRAAIRRDLMIQSATARVAGVVRCVADRRAEGSRARSAIIVLLAIMLMVALTDRVPQPKPVVSILPAAISIDGDCVFIKGTEPNFGANAYIDVDSDGVIYTARADADGYVTLQVPHPAISGTLLVQSRDSAGLNPTGYVGTLVTQLSPFNSAHTTPVLRPAFSESVPICMCDGCGCEGGAEQGRTQAASTAGTITPQRQTRATTPVYSLDNQRADSINSPGLAAPTATLPSLYVGSDSGQRGSTVMSLTNVSGVDYQGPYGCSWSPNWNGMIIQDTATTGRIVTPNLFVFPISEVPFTTSGEWTLPDGFFSTLHLDAEHQRWEMRHFSGMEYSYYLAQPGKPGFLFRIEDRNGNRTQYCHDYSSRMVQITTQFNQVLDVAYDSSGLLDSLTDHLGRQWTFDHDAFGRLEAVNTPVTTHVAGPPGTEVTDTNLLASLTTAVRSTTFTYPALSNPNAKFVEAAYDGRGGKQFEITRNASSQTTAIEINNGTITFEEPAPTAIPAPLPTLEGSNIVTRVTDREGNITDFECHSAAGGPIGGAGPFGCRRVVSWTEAGKGNTPLRAGEPDYYESRMLHDCDCIRPKEVTQPWSSNDLGSIT